MAVGNRQSSAGGRQAWEGKSKGTRTGYRIFVGILRHFGVRPAYLLLRFVAFYYFLSSWKTSRAVLQFYRQGLQMNKLRALRMLYRNYYRLGQTLIDKVAAMAGIAGGFRSRSTGLEHLQALASGGKGGILLSAHVGNWEIAGHFLQKLNIRINLVMYDGEHQAIKEYLGSITGPRSFNVIVIQPDNSHIYQIAGALGRGELIGMHADRYLEGSKTLTLPFLGRPARFPEGPFLLAAKLRVPVSFVFAMKAGEMSYRFSASPPIQAEQLKDTAPQTVLQAYISEVENKVREYPDQWFNYFPFWG